MHSSEHIRGSEKLIAVFGEWPTFHDAEVVLFSVERAIPVKVGDNIARLVIHLRSYASTGEGTANYQMVLTKSVLAKFVFSLACDLELIDFNHQNVINSFTVSPFQTNEPANLSVKIESIWGFGGSFHCSKVELESVEILPIV
ncbi:Imm50 family immunity protein [Methylophilus methylotrophus]|uniref:Imm50 family immunity protein n=1 Tax=Methylophilus methylotrophus TaxID=17 RepID=UPI000F599AA6|nr:Imm50 family immunity protein [Methylophilus methylotrophus]